jgi:uncharacterized glyoxalase superfamily protein PhnB
MTMAVKPIPDNYPRVCPYLIVLDVRALLGFIEAVFDAQPGQHHEGPDGRVMHAEVRIGDSLIMMGEASDKWKAMPAGLHVYVADVDAAYQRALAAGATTVMAPADQFYGDRNSGVKDASGNTWWITSHIEDVTPEEISRRGAEMAKKAGQGG